MLALSLALSSCALGAAEAQGGPADLPPCPGGGRPARFYPEPALRRSLEGEVGLKCRVGDGRKFDSCAIESETPDGVNFGPSALAMAKCSKFKVGKPGDDVTLPVHFRLPKSRDPRPSGGITVTAIAVWVPR
jgi:TonB family protein